MVPECGGEGDVDFFQATVGHVVDGLEESRREGRGRREGVEFMTFEPAEGSGEDDFVIGLLNTAAGVYGGSW